MLTPAIDNSSEFYPHHYLDEMLAGDLDGLRTAWRDAGTAAPPARLAGLGRAYSRLRGIAEVQPDTDTLADAVAAFHADLVQALGYTRLPDTHLAASAQGSDLAIPILVSLSLPRSSELYLLICGDGLALAGNGDAEVDPLALPCHHAMQGDHAFDGTWEAAIDAIFAADDRPRFIVYLAGAHILLLEAHKWVQGRVLRVDLDLAFGRKDTTAFLVAAALCSKQTLLPDGEQLLHDRLEENAHKHAYGVTKDLKHGIIHAVELLANCWADHELSRRREQKRKLFDDDDAQGRATARELKTQCMRYLYRLLFLFYVEARPDLNVVPMAAEAYRLGYSLEALRDLEQAALTNPHAHDGSYFQQHLERLFSLIFTGLHPDSETTVDFGVETIHDGGFTLKKQVAELFDPAGTRWLNSVETNNRLTGRSTNTQGLKIPNHILQTIIQSLSLSAGSRRHGRGRISYATLGIEQLGSVYESLLSYSGFFATEPLLELKRSQDKADDADVQTWFAPVSDRERFQDDELIWEDRRDGRGQEPRIIREGTFVFRLAGRDRAESASFYTPKVLTEALVKYSLMELIGDGIKPLKERQDEQRRITAGEIQAKSKPTADDILNMTVLDSAMGCASFLTEAIDQLAQAYLERKQAETGIRIPVADLDRERARVRHHLAINGCYGVDLNPIAVELAQTSLWLACIHPGASVPWFGLRLASGNSLIGARRAYYSVDTLLDGTWSTSAPTDLDWSSARPKRSVYHFLLPHPDMLGLDSDKVVKDLAPEACAAIKAWRKDVVTTWDRDEVTTLLRLSAEIDRLFDLYTAARRQVLADATPATQVWSGGTLNSDGSVTPTYRNFGNAQADLTLQRRELDQLHATNSAFRRLKLAMDSWCGLWFWPLSDHAQLPGRGLWLTLLELCLVDQAGEAHHDDQAFSHLLEAQAKQLDIFSPAAAERPRLAETLRASGEDALLRACSGGVDISVLATKRPFFAVVQHVADQQRFHHWELAFPEVFRKGGFHLQVGNPPWLNLEWEERGILGDFDPAVGLKGLSSSDTALRRSHILAEGEAATRTNAYLAEKVRFEGMQAFLNSHDSYGVLKGIRTNLYKCFIVRSWWLGHRQRGMIGIFHQSGMFDDPRGALLRSEQYSRLKLHVHSPNKMLLFAEVEDQKHYEWSCYSAQRQSGIQFIKTSSIFHPQAITRSLTHDGHGTVPGIKDANFNWDVSGHASRLVPIDETVLARFAALLDEPGTPAKEARLPVVHSREILNVLLRFADQPQTLGSQKDQWAATQFFNERNAQSDGTIKSSTQQLIDIHQWVLQGPHFYIGTPFNKTPNEGCRHNQDYSEIDRVTMAIDYLPRTNYIPACSPEEYRRRIPTWQRPLPQGGHQEERFDQRYRQINRRQLAVTGERTFISTIIPPGPCNVHTVNSLVYSDDRTLSLFVGLSHSLPYDFFVRVSGKSDLYASTLSMLPCPTQTQYANQIIARALRLNCLTSHYAGLWAEQWALCGGSRLEAGAPDHRSSHANEVAARQGHEPLTYRKGRYDSSHAAALKPDPSWSYLSATWTEHSPLRTDFARRQTLVELDVLAALALGLSLEELLTIYRVQFPVLQEYETKDRYDQLGRKLPIPALNAWKALKESDDKHHTPFSFESQVFYPPFTACRREDDLAQAYERFSQGS